MYFIKTTQILLRGEVYEDVLVGQIAHADQIPVVGGTKISSANANRLAKIGKFSRLDLQNQLHGRFLTRDQKASNNFSKGSNLVLSHNVLAVRTRSVLGGVLCAFVVTGTFRRATYHVVLELGENAAELKAHYCSCFCGRSICVHTVAAVFVIARYQGLTLLVIG